jgi:hypothetical protein
VLGVPVGGSSVSIPAATQPIGVIDNSQRLQQLIIFPDEASPGSKRRPTGVFACDIYRKISGAPPVDFTECNFLTLDTETPYLAYTTAQRWEKRRIICSAGASRTNRPARGAKPSAPRLRAKP